MSAGRVLSKVLTAPLIALVVVYQNVISPLRPPTCRFYPSCSSYALTALRRFGPVKGTWLAARRLLRCHPWNPGGVDHVPQRAPEHLEGHLHTSPDGTSPVVAPTR